MRNKRIDVLKFIGIFFVVLGHLNTPFTTWIYTFHMPLFFFVSGYLYREKYINQYNDSFGSFAYKRFKKTLIPYVFFWILSVIIYNNLFFLINFHKFATIGLNQFKGLLYGGVYLFKYSNNIAIWYLQAYFVISIVFDFMNRFIRNKYIKFVLFVLLLLESIPLQQTLPMRPIFNADTLISGLIFMYIGYILKPFISSKEYENIFNNIFVGIFFIFLGWYLSTYNTGSIGNMNSYMYYICASASILGFYIISYLIKNKEIFAYIGQHTLCILGIHFITFQLSEAFVDYFLLRMTINNLFIHQLMVVFVSISICVALSEIYKTTLVKLKTKFINFKRTKSNA